MVKLILSLLAVTLFPKGAMACDTQASTRLQMMLSEMSTIRREGDKLHVYWRDDWKIASRTVKEQFVRGFADSDACLNARSRDITFYYRNKVVARATPGGGIRLID